VKNSLKKQEGSQPYRKEENCALLVSKLDSSMEPGETELSTIIKKFHLRNVLQLVSTIPPMKRMTKMILILKDCGWIKWI